MDKVTFDCCKCNETVTCLESHMHYCDECGDGPFCDACWREHKRTCGKGKHA